MDRAAFDKLSWLNRPQRDELEDVTVLKSTYLEHAFWQWFAALPPPAQDRFHQVGTLLEGLTVALTHPTSGQPSERGGYPFEDEAGLRFAELTPQAQRAHPFLQRRELDQCLEITLDLTREFLSQAFPEQPPAAKDGLLRVLAYLHFATYGAMVRKKRIRDRFLSSALSALERYETKSTISLGLRRIQDQVQALLAHSPHAGRAGYDALSARISDLHTALSRFPDLLAYLIKHELNLAERLPQTLSALRKKLFGLLKDSSFVPDNPKVELFLRRTAVQGYFHELRATRQPFSNYHLQVVRPPYEAVRQVIAQIEEPSVRSRAGRFVARITRLMEYLRLVRARQERRELRDPLSALPIGKLTLALSMAEVRAIVSDFVVSQTEEELDLDFDSGFEPSGENLTTPLQLFDPAASTARLDAQEVAAALEGHEIEKPNLDENRLYDVFAIFTWRLEKTVTELEAKLDRLHLQSANRLLQHDASQTGDAANDAGVDAIDDTTGGAIPDAPDGATKDETQSSADPLTVRSALETTVQQFRESVLNQSRQVLWELCREIDDTLTFEEVIPEYKAGKQEALELRAKLQNLLERARHYGALLETTPFTVEANSALRKESERSIPQGERTQLLKRAFVEELTPFAENTTLLRPDDQEILVGKLAQIRAVHRPADIIRQIDDFVHFIESLLNAINRRWVLLIDDKERLEGCRTDIESLLLGSREIDVAALQEVAEKLISLGSRSPTLARAGNGIQNELVPLVESEPAVPNDGRKDGRRLIHEMIELRLETTHAALNRILTTSF
jgi:hypothetical protein